MESRKRITEEDLLVTEALIAESYSQLKQTVVRAPSRALRSAGNAARAHPYAAAATAIVAGVAVYGMYKMMTSRPGGSIPRQKEMGGTDLLQGLLPVIIPLITPYIAGYIQKYLGKIQAGGHG